MYPISKERRLSYKLRCKSIACVCMWQTRVLLNISQVPGSISSVLQTHSGKCHTSAVPPGSRCLCLFFRDCTFAVERLRLAGWCIHVQAVALGSCHHDRCAAGPRRASREPAPVPPGSSSLLFFCTIWRTVQYGFTRRAVLCQYIKI